LREKAKDIEQRYVQDAEALLNSIEDCDDEFYTDMESELYAVKNFDTNLLTNIRGFLDKKHNAFDHDERHRIIELWPEGDKTKPRVAYLIDALLDQKPVRAIDLELLQATLQDYSTVLSILSTLTRTPSSLSSKTLLEILEQLQKRQQARYQQLEEKLDTSLPQPRSVRILSDIIRLLKWQKSIEIVPQASGKGQRKANKVNPVQAAPLPSPAPATPVVIPNLSPEALTWLRDILVPTPFELVGKLTHDTVETKIKRLFSGEVNNATGSSQRKIKLPHVSYSGSYHVNHGNENRGTLDTFSVALLQSYLHSALYPRLVSLNLSENRLHTLRRYFHDYLPQQP
jgi:hypothetical protein